MRFKAATVPVSDSRMELTLGLRGGLEGLTLRVPGYQDLLSPFQLADEPGDPLQPLGAFRAPMARLRSLLRDGESDQQGTKGGRFLPRNSAVIRAYLYPDPGVATSWQLAEVALDWTCGEGFVLTVRRAVVEYGDPGAVVREVAAVTGGFRPGGVFVTCYDHDGPGVDSKGAAVFLTVGGVEYSTRARVADAFCGWVGDHAWEVKVSSRPWKSGKALETFPY